MHYFVVVYDLHPLKDLIKDINGLINPKNFATHLALDREEISHVAILHDQEVPITFCIDPWLP